MWGYHESTPLLIADKKIRTTIEEHRRFRSERTFEAATRRISAGETETFFYVSGNSKVKIKRAEAAGPRPANWRLLSAIALYY